MVSVVTGGGFKGAGAFRGGGFRMEFEVAGTRPRAALEQDAVAVVGASVEAVVKTTTEIKLRVRDYLDAHFTGSRFTRNNRRRISNTIQAKFYNEVASRGRYTGLVYSKFGSGHGPSTFIDFLLLHVRGGTVAPKSGPWLTIWNTAVPDARLARSGSFAGAGTRVFFVPSKDGQELFMLRSSAGGRTRQLLATLVKQVTIPAGLSGVEDLARDRPQLFEGHFAAALERLQHQGAQ